MTLKGRLATFKNKNNLMSRVSDQLINNEFRKYELIKDMTILLVQSLRALDQKKLE